MTHYIFVSDEAEAKKIAEKNEEAQIVIEKGPNWGLGYLSGWFIYFCDGIIKEFQTREELETYRAL